MTALTEKDLFQKYVDKDDVSNYLEKHKNMAARIQRLKDIAKQKRVKVTTLPKYQLNIRKIKRAIVQSKIRDETGSNVAVKGSTVEWQIIYGKARVGGVVTFVHTTSNNDVLHLVVTFACHECESVEKLFLDGEEVIFGASPDPRWSTGIRKKDGTIVPADHKVFMSPSLGHVDQAVNGDLTTQLPSLWTSAHRQRGRAHVYLILVWDATIFPDGLPEIELEVKGKKCYDPRLSGGAGGYAWTENAALITADYLMDTSYGLKVPLANIDSTILTSAANSCDTSMTLLDASTEARWRINGVIQASDSPQNILETMAAHMAGNIVFVNGKWRILPAEWRSSVLTITEDDVLGDIRVTSGASRKDLFNRVRGTFTDSRNDYIEADFPPVKNDFYKSLDNNEEIWEDVQLPLCVTASQAQRICKIELERVRAGLTVSFLASLRVFEAAPGDTISITNTRMGWSAKTFEVEETSLVVEEDSQGNPRFAVQVTAKETAAAVYDFSSYETSYDISPNTNLPNPFIVGAPSGLTLESGTDHLVLLRDGTVITRIKVSWTPPGDAFVTSGGFILVEYKKSSASDWIEITPTPGASTFAYIGDVEDGVLYDVRIRAKNAAGIVGAYISRFNYTVVGKTEPPSNVQGFTGAILGYGVRLSWDSVPDPDVSEYEIRIGSATEAWEDANLVVRTRTTTYIAELRLQGNYRFLIKAIDSTGNYSQTAAIVSMNIPVPDAPIVDLSLEGDTLVFRWTVPTSTFAIDQYEVTYGVVTETNPTPTYEASISLATIKGTTLRSRINWSGTRFFWVAAKDVAGNLGTPFLVTMTIEVPGITGLHADVVDNNVLLYWSEDRGTLPISKYYVYKGAAYETAEGKGVVTGTFIGLFETTGGTYTYWVVAEDSAGNKGIPQPITLRVSQPPDYVLRTNGTVDPREAQVCTNVFIEGFGFTGGQAGGGGAGGTGSPIGILLCITNPTPPIGGPGGIGSPLGMLLSITRSS